MALVVLLVSSVLVLQNVLLNYCVVHRWPYPVGPWSLWTSL